MFDPEKNDDYSPNPVQLEFIRLAAEKYWYLAFGDTDHSHPEISAFTTCSKMLNTLLKGGKEHYFLETPQSFQAYYDFASGRQDNGAVLKDAQKYHGSSFAKGEDRAKLCNIFERAVRENEDIKFFAADKRHSSKFKVLGHVLRGALKILFSEKTDRMYYKIITEELAYDQKTADFVKSFNSPSVITFGMAHFRAVFEDEDNPKHLGTLLKDQNKELCVFEIHNSKEQALLYDARRSSIPEFLESKERVDAFVYVNADDEAPYGIEVNNPKIQPLLDQAIENVRQREVLAKSQLQLPSI